MKHIIAKTLSVVMVLAVINFGATLHDERAFQSACQVYLWALPIVAFAQWQDQSRTLFGAGNLDFTLGKGYEGVSGILTPNVVTTLHQGLPRSRQDRAAGD